LHKTSIHSPDNNTYVIENIHLNDSILLEENQPFNFKIIMNNQDQDTISGKIIMTVTGVDEDKSKVEGSFNIDKKGFIDISIKNIIHTDSNPLTIEDSFFHRILYTIMKILIHHDAHHQQKVDNVVGIFDGNTNYKIIILENMINYLKTIETIIKNSFDNTTFGYDYLESSKILDLCARFEGFVAYIYSYMNIIGLCTTCKTKYINKINPILMSTKSFKSRIEAGKNSNQFEKIIGTGFAKMISSSILLINITKETENTLVLTKFEFFSIIVLFTSIAAGFIYFRTLSLYYILFNMSDISKQIKYAISLKKHSKQVYKEKVPIKVKILINILEYGDISYFLAVLYTSYLLFF
jgi:hypothetical protein